MFFLALVEVADIGENLAVKRKDKKVNDKNLNSKESTPFLCSCFMKNKLVKKSPLISFTVNYQKCTGS